jgi:Na+-driven multidrug efflux pump
LTNVYFIGHIHDQVAMAGIGMGHSLIGAFCMAFSFGLNGTLESKVS